MQANPAQFQQQKDFAKLEKARALLKNSESLALIIANFAASAPKRRFMQKKNRTPRNRIERKRHLAKFAIDVMLRLTQSAIIISTPIPKFPRGAPLAEIV